MLTLTNRIINLGNATETPIDSCLQTAIISEEKPTLAATSMNRMMLAHFSVRERTEVEWRGILERVGLRVIRIYTCPGAAESLIEAELA